MQVDWFFDPISPFAYLQAEQLATWLPGSEIRVRPVVLGVLLSYWETRGPAEIPRKRVQTYRSALWRAEALGIALRLPPAHPFDPLALLRLCMAAGSSFAAAREVLAFVWREGRTAMEPQALEEIGRRVGVANALKAIGRPEVKLALRASTESAISDGVFGVPALRIGQEIFWGEDATSMARRTYERGASWLSKGEWGRTATMPVGVQRKT